MVSFTWDGRSIEVACYLSRRYMWLATAEELRIDGAVVTSHGGFSLETRSHVPLAHRDGWVKVSFVTRVKWVRPLEVEFDFLVDGALQHRGLVPIGARWAT